MQLIYISLASMNRDHFYSNAFKVGAVWNWGAAALFAFAYQPLFALLGMPQPTQLFFLQGFCFAVFLFGAGYYWVGTNLTENRALVVLGIIGKVAVFLLLLGHSLEGSVHPLLISAGVVDLAFAAVFYRFLVVSRPHLQVAP